MPPRPPVCRNRCRRSARASPQPMPRITLRRGTKWRRCRNRQTISPILRQWARLPRRLRRSRCCCWNCARIRHSRAGRRPRKACWPRAYRHRKWANSKRCCHRAAAGWTPARRYPPISSRCRIMSAMGRHPLRSTASSMRSSRMVWRSRRLMRQAAVWARPPRKVRWRLRKGRWPAQPWVRRRKCRVSSPLPPAAARPHPTRQPRARSPMPIPRRCCPIAPARHRTSIRSSAHRRSMPR